MKNKKWLLIIVAFIFLVNLAYFLLTRSGKVDLWVQDRIIQQLEEALNAEVSFEYFTFNEKQLNVSGINISDKNKQYDINLKQIFVEFSLLELLFSSFKDLSSINSIKLYEPEIVYNYSVQNGSAKNPTNSNSNIDELINLKIPDLSKFFKRVELYDGKFILKADFGWGTYHNSWQNINLNLFNEKQLSAELNALSNSSVWQASALIADKELKNITLNLTDFTLENLKIPAVDSIACKVGGNLSYSAGKLDYSLGISNLYTEKSSYLLEADLVNIAGNADTMLIDFTDIALDDNYIFAQFDLLNPFQKNPEIIGKILATEISTAKYVNSFGSDSSGAVSRAVSGLVDADIDISGWLAMPLIKAELNSSNFSVFGEDIFEIEVVGELNELNLNFQLDRAIYRDNLVTGFGSWNSKQGLSAELRSPGFQYKSGNFMANGDLLGFIEWKNQFDTNLYIANLGLIYNKYEVPDLTLNASIKNDKLNFNILNRAKSIDIKGTGDFGGKVLDTKMNFKRFNPNYIVGSRSLPLTSGYLNLKLDEENFSAESSVRLYDQNYGKLDGRFNTNFEVNFADSSSLFNLRSKNAKFNYEDFKIELLAKGSLDSLHTIKFLVNDEIELESWIELNPTFSYGFRAIGDKIKLKDYASYFSDSYTASNLEGWTDFDLNYCSANCKKVGGYLDVRDLKYENLMPLDLNLKLSGVNDRIIIDEMKVFSSNQLITNINGDLELFAHPELNIQGEIIDFPLENFLNKSSGNLIGDFKVNWSGNRYDFGMNIQGDNFQISGIDIDNFDLNFNQNDSLLIVHNLYANKRDLFELNSSGKLALNAFKSEYSFDERGVNYNDSLVVSFSGDILKLLEENVKEFSSGNSQCNFNLSVGVNDGGLIARKGSFVLSDGVVKLSSQPTLIEKMKINLQIENNELKIDDFSLKVGDGKLSVSNEIGYNDLDIYLANINIGALLLKTNSDGILFYMPGYMPKNSQVKAVLKGREAKYATITGPIDELRVTADLLLSNGDAIYPPNTENLFKLINNLNKQNKSSKHVVIPLELDLQLFFGENIRYVTYPTDLKVASGSYIFLKYIEEKFSVPDALFSCYEGSIDILGTNLEAEQIQVNINQSIKGVKIVGEFQKVAADGTVISLIVRRDEEQGSIDDYLQNQKGDTGSSYGDTGSYDQKIVDLEFRSDNSSDSMLDILSLLRYGRRSDELTASQTGSLIQDEVIQLAGVGIESAFLDPLISPLENWVRKTLHLDYFRLQTDIIQNIFSNYSSLNSSADATLLEEEENNDLSKFDTDMFLNNLSVNMGRYLTRTVFLDYEARVSKQNEYIAKSKIGVSHYFTVRYNLPWKLKLSYEYNIEPFGKDNSHQLQLERTFHFY